MRTLSEVTNNEIVDALACIYGVDLEDREICEQIAENLEVSYEEMDDGIGERVEALIQAEELWEFPDGRVMPTASSWARILNERMSDPWFRVPEGRAKRIEEILTGAL